MIELPMVPAGSTVKRRPEWKPGKPADDRAGTRIVFRGRVVQARMAAHGIDWRQSPHVTLNFLACVPLERWLGRDERAFFLHGIGAAWRYYEAALENVWGREDLAVGRVSRESLFTNCPVRLRFAEASIVGGMGEGINNAVSKNWGDLVGVEPLEVGTPFDPDRILQIHHANSKFNCRVEQRKRLKRILGREHRPLVGQAMGETKGRFLAGLAAAGAAAIHARLGLDPGEFWRAVNARVFLDLGPQYTQGELF